MRIVQRLAKDPRDEKGVMMHIGLALSQKLNPESTNHVPRHVATVTPYQSDSRRSGHKMVFRGAISGKNELQINETLPNKWVGAVIGEMMVATESDLTIGTRLKPSFTDGQQNAQTGSGWPGF